MDLKGAEIRNILQLCMMIGSTTETPLKVNIPYYQRPYRWDKDRIESLIDDFCKNKKENNNVEYFVGSVVLVKDNSVSDKYDVIDGQQRITTIFLLNYLRFVIQRSYIEEKISIKAPNIDTYLKELESIYSRLFGSVHVDNFKKMHATIIEKMESIYELDDLEKERAFKEISDLYRETVYLPERDFSDYDKYYELYEKKQKEFLISDKLALSYSRHTFNDTLFEALAKICVIVSKDSDPKIDIIGISEKTNPNILQYTNAIKYEFEAISKICLNENLSSDSRDKKQMLSTKAMLAFIEELIENVKFCVIMTGNERDAYTLFEVLNDRAMEIDDLELIKNLFLKAYCKYSGDQDSIIDNNIGKLDQLWGDEIFTRDLADANKKLISYLGTLYLTANENAFTNKLERYREILEKDYLKEYNGTDCMYSYQKVLNDIKVYQMIRTIIEDYGLKIRNASLGCIQAENEAKVSITYKALHLLNALKYHGVMPALINIIIRQYMNKLETNGVKEVDIADFKTFIKEIKEDSNHNANSNSYKRIHELALKLWKAALLCKNYEIPREIAKKGLQCISRKEWKPDEVTISIELHNSMIEQFKEWIQNWQYGNTTTDLKVKALFINLFQTNKNNNELNFDKTVYTFKTDKLQLDHMEAQNPDKTNMEKHFTPKDDHEPRDKYIQALGNFMILDADNNNNKNNKPLVDAMDYYEKMCPKHWLNKETNNLLAANHNDVKIAGKSFMVPNEKFFNERAEKLRMYFEKILTKDLTATKIVL